jgi:hypothetical protein
MSRDVTDDDSFVWGIGTVTCCANCTMRPCRGAIVCLKALLPVWLMLCRLIAGVVLCVKVSLPCAAHALPLDRGLGFV